MRHAIRNRVFWGLAGVLATGLLAPAFAQSSGEEVFSQEDICREQYQTGLEYQKNNRLHDAAAAFSEVKEACPDMVDAYLNLGAIQVQLKEYLEAIDTYQDALDQDPENLGIKEAMAYALSSAGELEDARDLYLELNEQVPESANIKKNLAFVYKQLGQIAEAVMLYNRLIELGQADPTMVSDAGRMALEQKLFFPAVAFYQKLYEVNPEDVGTLSILGGYYWKIKFYGNAIPYYEKILEIDPESAQALLYHKILGVCYKETKDYPKAIEHYMYVIEHEPDLVQNYCTLAFILKDAGEPERAIEIVQRGLQISPNEGCLHYAHGTALLVWSQIFEGRRQYDAAIEKVEEAKAPFTKCLNDARYGRYARQQLDRIEAVIDRLLRLKDQQAERSGR